MCCTTITTECDSLIHTDWRSILLPFCFTRPPICHWNTIWIEYLETITDAFLWHCHCVGLQTVTKHGLSRLTISLANIPYAWWCLSNKPTNICYYYSEYDMWCASAFRLCLTIVFVLFFYCSLWHKLSCLFTVSSVRCKQTDLPTACKKHAQNKGPLFW